MSCLLRMQTLKFQLLLKSYDFDIKWQKSLFIEYNSCCVIKSANKFVCFLHKNKSENLLHIYRAICGFFHKKYCNSAFYLL